MTLIRPEAAAALMRWREVAAAAGLGAAGAFLVALGGLILAPLGAILLLFAAAWAVMALRRLRFTQAVAAPGVVEIEEGQIGYLGPAFGGYAALPDIVELRLLTLRGRRLWRLKQADGEVLLIPVDAAGAGALFDAFAGLPGLDTAVLVAALDPDTTATGTTATNTTTTGTALAAGPATRLIWRRPGPGLAPRG